MIASIKSTIQKPDQITEALEHFVLRLVSFIFSVVSAHAIRWIFSPLDTAQGADYLQPFITWAAAGGFGILGYFVSRGLAYRLMKRESFWSYVPICLVVELVEIFANYAQAAAVIQNAAWIHAAPQQQQVFLVFATYIVLSIIPLASVFLAVVDMDLERSKNKSRQAVAPVANKQQVKPMNPIPNKAGPQVPPGPNNRPNPVPPAQPVPPVNRPNPAPLNQQPVGQQANPLPGVHQPQQTVPVF